MQTSPTGERVHPIAVSTTGMSAREAFAELGPFLSALGSSRRLFLVLSGAYLDANGRASEWQFHFIYPNDQREAIFTVALGQVSPIPGGGAVIEKVVAWPPAGSTQEAMLQFQGPAARLIVEQQWVDRVERLPGLPEQFIDSSTALETIQRTGVDLQLGGGTTKLKGRTPPGGYPVWEIVTGFEVLHTPFLER